MNQTSSSAMPKNTLFSDLKDATKLWPYIKQDKKILYFSIFLIPLTSAIMAIQPFIIKHAIDEGIVKSNTSILIKMSLIYILLIIATYITQVIRSYTSALVINRMVMRLRKKLFTHVLTLKPSFHDRSMSGALVTRATSDFDNLNESLSVGVLRSVADIFLLIGGLIGVFILNWRLALITLGLLPFVLWTISFFSRLIKKVTLLARKDLSKLNAFSQECLYGSTTVKLLSARKDAERRHNRMSDSYRKNQTSSVIYDAVLFSMLDGVSSIAIGLALWVTVTNFFSTNLVTAGVMIAFVSYLGQIFEPLKFLGSTMALLQGVFTALERIFGILETDEYIEGNKELELKRGDIKFNNVFFRYNNKQDDWILKNVSFSLAQGESLALVGKTGSGKSTIIKLLSKMYDNFVGDILLDGHSIKQIDNNSLRKQISIVPQDIVLFEGSVSYNIGLENPDISMENIYEAAKIVGADNFIEKLPGGFDFIIKEQGTNLSLGQQQLIVFARALARNPKLVILDEATSSIDPRSERDIQTAIDKILENRSVIVIAHRLSTIRKCDKILVLNNGEVIEEGNHDSLIKKKGAYFELQQKIN